MSIPRRAVYTALTGNYELLPEQPVAKASDVAFICFTDDPELRSDSWDVRVVPTLLDLDPVRSARALKIGGHPDLAEYDETLWIDARVLLKEDPAVILDTWLDGTDLALPRHSYRKDVVTEFEEVLLAGMDDSSRLYEQLTHYSAAAPELLERPVPWTGMIARRHTQAVDRAMQEWLVHVLRYSRRDQLSFVHAVSRAGVGPRLLELDTWGSALHDWLPGAGRSSRPPIFRVSDSLRAPTARLGELQRQLEVTTTELSAALSHRENVIERLEGRVAQLERALAKARGRARRLRRKLDAQDTPSLPKRVRRRLGRALRS
ncbi:MULTISPECIES: glycosyltransferase domain-containing protein [Nocardioides]|uniref:Glycosyltransferase domain-containing protein n=1 Tax=Nocardioides vastitatis TaxID=2568655 RepID=A0ABW0ZJL8_9ACTN|nr:glycosyltransferase domain-containing protein [Nocardioides sp.]